MKIIGSPEGEIGLEAELRAFPEERGVVIRFCRPGTDQSIPGGMFLTCHAGIHYGDACVHVDALNVMIERLVLPAFEVGDQIAALEAENADLRNRLAEFERQRAEAENTFTETRLVVQRRRDGGEWSELSASEPVIAP